MEGCRGRGESEERFLFLEQTHRHAAIQALRKDYLKEILAINSAATIQRGLKGDPR